MDHKIFCIGFNKTGTTSLHHIFKDQLKLRSSHYTSWPKFTRDKYLNPEFFKDYDCFSDGERPNLENIDRVFPGSKFILTTRSLFQWLLSCYNHIEKKKANPNYKGDADNSDKKMMERIYNRQIWYMHVQEYFLNRKNDIIAINIESEDNESLINRLNCFLNTNKITYVPHYRKNKQDTNSVHIERVLSELNIDEAEWHSDTILTSLDITEFVREHVNILRKTH